MTTSKSIEQQADEIVLSFWIKPDPGSAPYMNKQMAVTNAITHVTGIIEVLGWIRKPEYTTFVLKYTEIITPDEIMDGNELIDHYTQILTILKSKKQ